MSRVGKLPIHIPSGVFVDISGLNIRVQGPKGILEKTFQGEISLEQADDVVSVKNLNSSDKSRAMWGTARSVINAMVKGVTQGFSEELEINGVGYRASIKDGYINLSLGKSHNTKIAIPSGIKAETPKQNIIMLESSDKEQLGQYVAVIKRQRLPEPYKGKGIKRKGEYVQRKEGKKN